MLAITYASCFNENGNIVSGTLDRVDKQFGEQIRVLRVQRDKSQSELGSALGVDQRQVSKYEAGASSFPAARIPALCQFLNITPDQLFADLSSFKREITTNSAAVVRIAALIENFPKKHRAAVLRYINDLARAIANGIK